MTAYSAALFLHVLGALGFFAALALDWSTTTGMRRAGPQARELEWRRGVEPLRWLFPLSGILLLGPGIYMSVVVWGAVGWIVVSLASLLALAIVGSASGRALDAVLRSEAPSPPTAADRVTDARRRRLLWASLHVRTAVAVGIVFLMTVKPAAVESVVVVVLAAALGAITSRLSGRAEPARPGEVVEAAPPQ